ncbi:aminoglycoside phosphotransferase family protein [Dactylosporangium vinaceum]|uniref:Phosphotransferase family protein n=1 Tax=Dactylosporangium vinaceum TaxID=53362 RepID=A0ABV5MCR4_9ACTN|nr:aminoglycoside phosphotransferase family protein [Dactylosporangium vinaceum]UAB92088.1 aminoglycoside phosphotransferase family protein [Dactylosporangium vinaceum]
MVTWLGAPSVAALREALHEVAPQLGGGAIVPRNLVPDAAPEWSAATAVLAGRYVVKFAWAEPAALRIRHQARVLGALKAAAPWLALPAVVVASESPALLVTELAAAVPFFDVRHLVGAGGRARVGQDLGTVLARLHDPGVLAAVSAAAGPLAAPVMPAATDVLRRGPAAPDVRWERVAAWCDWTDRVLGPAPGRAGLVHGDFHGGNHLWDERSLRLELVVDWETAGPAEPEYDLRCLPGDCGMELFGAVVDAYERVSGAALDRDRIMGWHVRTVLDDVLWRVEAGVPMPDRRTAGEWVDDLGARLAGFGVGG